MTKAGLMEVSNETLALYGSMLQAEAARRGIKIDAVALHPGNVENGKPVPLVVRVIRKLPGLPPADLAKLEVMIDAFVARGSGA